MTDHAIGFSAAEYEKLRDALAELFELDKVDLDFGIYKLLNARNAEIGQFLERRLPHIVRTELSAAETASRERLEKELEQAVADAKRLKIDPETNDLVGYDRTPIATLLLTGEPEASEKQRVSRRPPVKDRQDVANPRSIRALRCGEESVRPAQPLAVIPEMTRTPRGLLSGFAVNWSGYDFP